MSIPIACTGSRLRRVRRCPGASRPHGTTRV
jgi:hypothetical protein